LRRESWSALQVKRGLDGGRDFFGVSSGKSEIMRYSNQGVASSMAVRRALLGIKTVSVISGTSVKIANVCGSAVDSVTLVNP